MPSETPLLSDGATQLLHDWLAQLGSVRGAGQRTLVVTHAGPIRAALAAWERPIAYGEAISI